ncbi:class I SAM-dependent methyltransferase [Roseomonas sp. USHLN139]|uniref:class I SAM-dependent methyltransferase n=1 Tax=Roseomonas sp. USHLN139 TaxID=3081298 RepID=UPI003B028CB2
MTGILDAIGRRHGTDKASDRNDFLRFYEPFVAPMRDQPVKVLEIGVLGGGSVRMWRDYFANGQVIGADINEAVRAYAGERLSIEIADQSSLEDMRRLAAMGPFDLIIDDGSHVWKHQIDSFNTLFPSLRPGGLYIIEDLDTSHGRYIPDYCGGGGPSCMQYLQTLSDWVVGWRQIDGIEANEELRRLWPMVDYTAFYRGTGLIRRKY